MSPDEFGLDYYEALMLHGLHTVSVVKRDFSGDILNAKLSF